MRSPKITSQRPELKAILIEDHPSTGKRKPPELLCLPANPLCSSRWDALWPALARGVVELRHGTRTKAVQSFAVSKGHA
jgi:hypothetical protein